MVTWGAPWVAAQQRRGCHTLAAAHSIYSATNGALASGFVTAELHHLMGHDRYRLLLLASTEAKCRAWGATASTLASRPSSAARIGEGRPDQLRSHHLAEGAETSIQATTVIRAWSTAEILMIA
ncbi:MAG: hypothetical protein E5X49_17065 [Mesorhizobium sp.]|nr:MAG: hypothetical protein E5X49_17065 [Mesorhizobium sp.]